MFHGVKSNRVFFLPFLLIVITVGQSSGAEDWPCYMRDNARSGVTAMSLELPLTLQWVHYPSQPPAPAWPEPAKQDFWNQVRELSPVVVYDRAYHVVSVGDAVYYASSADDQVYCLDAASGVIRWRFFAEGPVRLAPAIANERVYFTSDDGYAYCLHADTGALVWRYSPATHDRRLPGNSRIISYAPARTGMVVDGGVAYLFSGLFPPDQAYKCALDAATGDVLHRASAEGVSPQGYLLASSTRLFVPTGRTAPVMFNRDSMENLGALQGPGGAYALLVDDAIVSGPGVRAVNQLHYTPQETRERMASFPGVRMLVHEGISYLQGPEETAALDRQRYLDLSVEINRRNDAINQKNRDLRSLGADEAEVAEQLGTEIAALMLEVAELETQRETCYLWKRPGNDPYAMILVSDVLYLGGQSRIEALRAEDGETLWRYDVEGRIYGLAAANGRLYASSSTGAIYCFSAEAVDEPQQVRHARNEEPYGEDELSALYDAMAREIIEIADTRNGYCLVLGAGEGRLAHALARHSELRVIGVERDAARVAVAREALAAAGLYGMRVSMHHVEYDALPYTSYLANLVVSEEAPVEGSFSWDIGEVYRVLRPYGGKALLRLPDDAPDAWSGDFAADAQVETKNGWTVVTRGAVPGAGEWTQLYADASHTAYSGDQLRGPVTVQWFGDPGPRDMVDRHHRPMSSLFQKGRLFITGDNKIITVDGYNGSPLWELEVPDSRRIGVMKSSGHQLLADDRLYIVRADECWAVDVATGRQAHILKAPTADDAQLHWGYLNTVGDTLIGSLQAADANFDRMSKMMVQLLEGDFRPVIMSASLFALDRNTGALRWRYENGRILNAMITVVGERIYLVESRNALVMDNTNGRIRIQDFLGEDAYLVALNAHTGAVEWERQVNVPFEHIAYLNGRDGILLASGSCNEGDRLYYDLFTFDMNDGADKWHTRFIGLNIRATDISSLDGTHGEQWQHPVITEDTIYLRPFAFSLETGEQKDYIAYRGGHGCGGFTGSAHYLYGRGSVPRMYPTYENSTEGIPLTEVSRPGCFLNIIPAGGIIMAPESSSGCTCAYPLQTSFGFIPVALAGGVKRDF